MSIGAFSPLKKNHNYSLLRIYCNSEDHAYYFKISVIQYEQYNSFPKQLFWLNNIIKWKRRGYLLKNELYFF